MTMKNNAAEVAKAILAGKGEIDTAWGVKSLDGLTNMIKQASQLNVTLMEQAESFISGFEDEVEQPGVTKLLEDLRKAIAESKN